MLDKETQLAMSLVLSCVAYRATRKVIPRFKDKFIQAHLVGVDQAKRDKKAM